jgi:hypothetical protein
LKEAEFSVYVVMTPVKAGKCKKSKKQGSVRRARSTLLND